MKKNIQDEKIKELLSGTTLKASDNLKYRIMRQIQTESYFSKKKIKAKSSESVWNSLIPVLGVMYALITSLGLGMYFTSGKEGLLSPIFFAVTIMIVTICSAFLVITFYDNKRRMKYKKK